MHAFLMPYFRARSPADADGAFLAKLMPVFQKVSPNVVPDVSDDTSVNVTSDATDTTYGGDLFFNLTRCVEAEPNGGMTSL
jgi:hypothetical protein